MVRRPSKVRENSPIAHVRALQRAHNELVDELRQITLQNSPSTRIERLPGGGVTVHTKSSSTVVSTDDTWY